MLSYESTSLWKSTLGQRSLKVGVEQERVNSLRLSYQKLESRICDLLAKIPEDCRDLTLHDISHVHQLWAVADEICGPNFPLNPLEGFVLGAAFLVHDAGLTASAYPGGLKALKKTSYFCDRVAALLRRGGGAIPIAADIENASPDVIARALFDTLRALHAHQAEFILGQNSQHPLTGERYALFSDDDLFLDCGSIIGQVAASHHWPIERVRERFHATVSAPASFPGWHVDPLKLACILRAADACAIDERRSRILPFIMTKPSGVSRNHWMFQAYMKPAVAVHNRLVFQSKRPFPRGHMLAWWTAYEAIGVADRELRDCDKLLRQYEGARDYPLRLAFQVSRVEGANDPEMLARTVSVEGWKPVDTAARIENPIALIEKLGGWALYGDDASAPLRELVQNASDAVRARRTRAGGYDKGVEYPGHVKISLNVVEEKDEIKSLSITISDDGIGMAPEVMTGALLDFGRSFWGTEEAISCHPGLLSDPDFEPAGQFGVGFYAIFMIADDVKIISRPWDAGIRDAKVLHFKNGVASRAEFRDFDEYEDGRLSTTYVTTINISVSKLDWINKFAGYSYRIRSDSEGVDESGAYWKAVVRSAQMLFFASDVKCVLAINGDEFEVNSPGIMDAPASTFAERYNEVFFSDNISNGDKILSSDELLLLASVQDRRGKTHTRGLSQYASNSGIIHIGGMTVFGVGDGLFKGIVGYRAGSAARRGGRPLAARDSLQDWIKGQLKLALEISASMNIISGILANMVRLNVDIVNDSVLLSDDEYVFIRDFLLVFRDGDSIFIALERQTEFYPWRLASSFGRTYFKTEDIDRKCHAFRFAGLGGLRADLYNKISGPFSSPDNFNSGYASLFYWLNKTGFDISVESPAKVTIGYYCGPEGGRGHLKDPDLVAGSSLQAFGLVLTLRKRVEDMEG